MKGRNAVGFLLLTLIILYYVVFTITHGHTIAWYSVIGIAAYLLSAWLLLSEPAPED